MLVLHGGAGQPRAIARIAAMHRIAEREGFIVAYPAGTPGRLGLTWKPHAQRQDHGIDDVDFVRKLIVELRRRYNVDPRRIYAAGMSIGGTMAYQLACSLSDTLAAIGVVAGVMLSNRCAPEHPVSVIHIHGMEDQRVPFRGGRGRLTARNNNWPPVREGIERWCTINRCTGRDEATHFADGVTGYRRTGVADVELWLIEQGRHVWPGGALADSSARHGASMTSGRFSASDRLWHFFAAHPKPEQ